MDNISKTRLEQVHPQLADLIRQLDESLLQQGIVIRVVQGLRTWGEQDALYQQGRTKPGKIVTEAPAGHSWHNFGLAVDVTPSTQGPGQPYNPDWNSSHPNWKTMESIGVSLGLVSGATWRSIPDAPHFQLTGSLPVSPDDATRKAFTNAGGGDAGIKTVWELAGMSVRDPTQTR